MVSDAVADGDYALCGGFHGRVGRVIFPGFGRDLRYVDKDAFIGIDFHGSADYYGLCGEEVGYVPHHHAHNEQFRGKP